MRIVIKAVLTLLAKIDTNVSILLTKMSKYAHLEQAKIV